MVTSIHPHQSGASHAPPPNLQEDQVTGLARPAHLVAVPGDDRVGVVRWADDLELSHANVGDSTAEGQDVLPDDAALLPHFLRQDVHGPHRVYTG